MVLWDEPRRGPDLLIKRLQVEEGFLDGLDVEFTRGLNVLIGPRGAGKTSVIELIRYCLGLSAVTERAAKQVRQHALSVLGAGRVTLTVEVEGEERTLSRSSDSEAAPPPWARGVIVLGQGEIENIGIEPRGRVALVDAFIAEDPGPDVGQLESTIRSLSVEIRDTIYDLDGLAEQLAERIHATEALAEAEAEQQNMMEAVAATATEQADLDRYQVSLANASARLEVLTRARRAIAGWRDELKRAAGSIPELEAWPESAEAADGLAEVRNELARASNSLRAAHQAATSALQAVDAAGSRESEVRTTLSTSVRDIRQRLESLHQGAGSVARRVTELRELAGQATALQRAISERSARRDRLMAERRTSFAELQKSREAVSRARMDVARRLASQIGARIAVSIGPSEALDAYASAIAAGLRGSGLHYSSLAEALADLLTPLELSEMVELGDTAALSQAAGLPLDRAARVVAALQESGIAGIVTAPVEDTVTLALEMPDGSWRTSDGLSTGQRCTVVLPLVLTRHGQPVILDQPEDNLDNAYVADTVVEALAHRRPSDQFIFATHNPNIPVLADADRVIALVSDGRIGRVKSAAPLLAKESVAAITSVMEGGRDAFARRAQLYASRE